MDITAFPLFEKRAIDQVRHARRDEKVPPLYVRVVAFVARWTANHLLNFIVERINEKNQRLTDHIQWFKEGAPELLHRVVSTNEHAGDPLLSVIDGLLISIDKDVLRLEKLTEDLVTRKARQDLIYAVRRSVSILKELKHSVYSFREAGVGVGEVKVVSAIPEAEIHPKFSESRARSHRLAASLRDSSGEFDPELLEAAEVVLKSRTKESIARPSWARELVSGE